MDSKEMELTPLKRAYEVDEAINTPDKSLIVIVRFGRETKNTDVKINEVDGWLKSLGPKKYSASIKVYTVQMKAVPELVARYKLVDPVTVLFFRDNIQGGRVQGSDIKEQEIDDVVKKLANKQTKDKSRYQRPQMPAAPTAPTSSNKKEPLAWLMDWIKTLQGPNNSNNK